MTHRQMSPDVKDRMLPLNLSSWHESCRLNERNTCLNSSVTGMSRLSKGQSARKAFKSGAGYLWQQPLGTNILTHPRTSKSKTWTRPVPTQSPTQVTQVVATVRSSTSSSPPEQLNAKVVAQRSQQLQLSDRTPGQAVEGNIRVLQSPNPETRRLIHKGRYKLVQPKPQAGLGQQQPSLQHRKRALSGSFSATSQVAKRRNTWVRSTSKAKGPPALVTNSKPFTSIFVRSSHTRKLQLIRKLSASSAGPLTRRWSKSPSLARSLPSARYLSGARRPALGLKTPGVVKPGKLQRIGGVLYKVGGSGFNRSLRRQSTPQTLRNDATPQAAYIQRGNHLVLRSLLKSPSSLVRKARPLVGKGAPTPVRPAVPRQSRLLSNKSAPKLVARRVIRKPNKLHRGNVPTQAHCLVYCRTGQCKEQQAGKCNLAHDAAAVAVCPAWLQGTCSNAACKLQHCKCPDVMPVCIFYLQGLCTSEDCPYAHVKVDPLAPVCQDFVKGHCPRGTACTKKHLAPRMIRQLRQSKALQVDVHSDNFTQQASSCAVADTDDVDLRPSFLRM